MTPPNTTSPITIPTELWLECPDPVADAGVPRPVGDGRGPGDELVVAGWDVRVGPPGCGEWDDGLPLAPGECGVGFGRWEEWLPVGVTVGCVGPPRMTWTSAACGGANDLVNVVDCPPAVTGTSTIPIAASTAGKVIVMRLPSRLKTPWIGFVDARYDGRADHGCGPPGCQLLVAG